MKKGFTLIELLAVIVILAIIAVIAVPIVLNIIEDAKESATLRSAEFYMDSVEMSIATSVLKGIQIKDDRYFIMEDGNVCIGALLNTTCTGDILKIEVSGNKPNSGYIVLENGTIKDIGVSLSDKVIKKDEKEELVLDDSLILQFTPGLYNDNDELVMSWEELVSQYDFENKIENGGYDYNTDEYLFSPGEVLESIEGPTKLVINDGVTSIGDEAFFNCDGLVEVIIPNSVTIIGNSAFFQCTNLTSITLGAGVTSIYDYAFEGCTSLVSIKIPDSVIDIGDGVFSGCTNLTSITIGNSVTSIALFAFFQCTNLTTITIPESVIYIDDLAFDGCDNLTTIYYKGNIEGADWIPEGVTVISDF